MESKGLPMTKTVTESTVKTTTNQERIQPADPNYEMGRTAPIPETSKGERNARRS